MRYRVYVNRPTHRPDVVQQVAVMEFQAYDFDVNGSTIVAYPYSKEIADESSRRCTCPSVDLQVPGYPRFLINDDHGRTVWDGEKRVPQ